MHAFRKLLVLCLVLVSVLAFPPSHSVAQVTVRAQLGFIIDGSGSIPPADFDLVKAGIANALSAPDLVPRDGTVEICAVQIAGDVGVTTWLSPTVVTEENIDFVTGRILAIQKGGGDTPTAGGIRLMTSLMTSSPNFAVADRQIIDIATDGVPNDRTKYPGDADYTYAASLVDAQEASAEAQAAGIDEIDGEAIGDLAAWPQGLDNLTTLLFPQPVVRVPPGEMSRGFLRVVQDINDFELAIREKLPVVLPTPLPTNTPVPTVPTLTPTPTSTRTAMPTVPTWTPPSTSTAMPTSTSVPSWTPTPTPVPEIPEASSLLLLASGVGALSGLLGWARARRGRSSREE